MVNHYHADNDDNEKQFNHRAGIQSQSAVSRKACVRVKTYQFDYGGKSLA